MANRSDFQSVLPRSIKKMIDLIPNIDAHQRGEIRRVFIGAHSTHKEVVKKRLSQKGENVDMGGSSEAAEGV
jgi:hypothetical protein